MVGHSGAVSGAGVPGESEVQEVLAQLAVSESAREVLQKNLSAERRTSQMVMESLDKLNQHHRKLQTRHDSLVFYTASTPHLDDLEEQIRQLDEKLEEQSAVHTKLEMENSVYWDENRNLKINNSRLGWENEELKKKLAASSGLLTEAYAANQKLQDQLATALQDGMDLVQQVAEARKLHTREVASATPPAKPAYGLLGYSTSPMLSPFEAGLQRSKPTPACMSSLDRASCWDKSNADSDGQGSFTDDATSPLPSTLDLTGSPSSFPAPILSGATTSSDPHSVLAQMQAQVEGAMSPLSPLLVAWLPADDTLSLVKTPAPAGIDAMLIGMPTTSVMPAYSASLQASAQANYQALSWGKTKVDFDGREYLAGDATSPLPYALDFSWSPSKFLAQTPPGPVAANNGASTSREVLPIVEAVPGLLSACPTSTAPSLHGPFFSTADRLSTHMLAQVEGCQLAVSPQSKLLVDCSCAPSVMGVSPAAEVEAMLVRDPAASKPPACAPGVTLATNAGNQAEVSVEVSSEGVRTPLRNLTNVLSSQVTNGSCSTPTSFSPDHVRSLHKAVAVSSPLKLAEAVPSPAPHPLQTHTFLSRDSASSESPGTPPNADLLSPEPALLRRSPGAALLQLPQVATLVRITPTLASSASDAAQTEVASQAPVHPVVSTPPKPPAELPSISSSTSSSRRCSKQSSLSSSADGEAVQSATATLSRPWSIAGPNSPATSSKPAPVVKPGRVAATAATHAQLSATRTGVTTRARASAQANVIPSIKNTLRPARQPATATTTVRTGAPGRAQLSTFAEASSRAGQHAKQPAVQAGTSHLAGRLNRSNTRSGRNQAPVTAVPSNGKESSGAGVKQSATISGKQLVASATGAAAKRPASGTKAAGRTKAVKAEVPTRVQPSRAARKGWRC